MSDDKGLIAWMPSTQPSGESDYFAVGRDRFVQVDGAPERQMRNQLLEWSLGPPAPGSFPLPPPRRFDTSLVHLMTRDDDRETEAWGLEVFTLCKREVTLAERADATVTGENHTINPAFLSWSDAPKEARCPECEAERMARIAKLQEMGGE